METAGARLEAGDLLTLLDEPGVLGLAEMMNYPGVIAAAPDVLAKLRGVRRAGRWTATRPA